MRSKIIILSVLIVLTLVYLDINPAPAISAEEDDSEAAVSQSKIKQLIFITKTKACACTQKRIDDANHVLKKFMQNQSLQIPRKDLDVQTDIAEITRLRGQTRWNFLPVLIFLDEDGKIITKLEGFVTEKQLKAILEENAVTKAEKPS